MATTKKRKHPVRHIPEEVRSKPGPEPRPDEEKRSRVVCFRLYPKEARAMEEAAKRDGLKLLEWGRLRLLDRLEIE